ncbi:MAG: hypothetical protein CMJ64_17115 [Planctomycetaceae bacterium]|nr:hypothetical protein [Planctomycetaceae bacterium]
MKQEFHLILGIDEITETVANALFEAGFDDAHLTKSDGRPCIVVDDRDTTDLAATVRSAVADAQRAGVSVACVKLPDVEEINEELASSF